MRQDPPDFSARNLAPSKEPRLVVRIVFDVATIYVTSDADMIDVPGAPLLGHLQNVSAVSQEIHPDEARSTIGTMSFALVDIESAMTDALRAQLQDEFQNLRGRTVQLRLAYTNDYDDTKLLFTQQVKACAYDDGTYRITCNDVQRETRKDIFEVLVTNLRLSVGEDDATIPVIDTTGFQTVFHGPSYTDAPNQTVGYIKLDDEIIRYTGTTADSFTGCTRAVFNTAPAEHEVQAAAAADRQPEVEEFVYLELPGPKLAYAILTGILDGDAATLPDHWHLGVDPSLVALTQFQQIGPDLWDTTDDDATLVLRFSGLEKTDGKRFLEEQVYQTLGVYSPVLADGRLGLRRMNHILADAPYVLLLNEDSFTQVGALQHDYDALLNVFTIDWNWDPIAERFTRKRNVIDQASIDVHGQGDTKALEWQGLHGSRHTVAVLLKRTDSIRDRYAGPPLRLTGKLLHSYNVLEVGDVVRVQLEHVRDYTGASGPIDRSFEVQRIAVDQISGDVSVSLFGSSQRSSVSPPDTGTALPDTWYSNAGTELSTVVTIVGGVIQPGTYTLTGNANLKNSAAVYYFLGDLELADGATLNIDDNVQLRIRGFFTINGDINGRGRGQAGAVDDGIFANANTGTPGFIGNTRGWEGLNHVLTVVVIPFLDRWPGPLTEGLHSAFPFLELSVKGGELVGLPDDIRGTSGGIGGRLIDDGSSIFINGQGGTGGDSGAGLAIICRGAALGASGSIDVSGGDGSLGEQGNIGATDFIFRAGSGAPGGPGGVLCVIDGSGPSLPDLLQGLTGAYGTTPSAGGQPTGTTGDGFLQWANNPPIRAGYNTSIVGDASASILRVQRLAPEQTPEEDVIVPAPPPLTVVTNVARDAHVILSTAPPAGVITEYFASITNDRGDAILLGASATGRFVNNPDPDQDTFYWARNREIDTRRVSLFQPNTTTTTDIGPALNRVKALSGGGQLVNGGFETGTFEGWTIGVAGPSRTQLVQSPVRSGQYAMSLELDSSSSGWGPLSDPVAVPAQDDRILVEAFVRRDDADIPTQDAFFSVRWLDEAGAEVDTETIGTADAGVAGWQFIRGLLSVPSGATSFFFRTGSIAGGGGQSGVWYWDDLSAFIFPKNTDIDALLTTNAPAEAGADVTAPRILGNGLIDGSLETGTLEGWEVISGTWSVITTEPRLGTYHLHGQPDGVGNARIRNRSSLQVGEGDRVLVMGFTQTVGSGSAISFVRVLFRDSAGALITFSNGTVISGVEYGLSRKIFVAPATAVSSELEFVLASSVGRDIYADGAYMQIIPRGADIILDEASGTVATNQIRHIVVPDPLITDPAFWDTSFGGSLYINGAGTNGTDAIQVRPSSEAAVFYAAARRGPTVFDAQAFGGMSVEVRWRARLTGAGTGGSWGQQLFAEILVSDEDGSNPSIYRARGDHAYSDSDTLNVWHNESATVVIRETDTVPRFMQIGIFTIDNLLAPTWQVDYLDATTGPRAFAGFEKPGVIVGTISTADPSGTPVDGELWIKHEP